MTKLVFNAETLAKSIDGTNGNEIVFEEYFDIQKSEGENPKDPKFEYFKKKILDHLAELEKKENGSIAKAIDIEEWIQKANFPVGTERTWNGQKFKKITPKKWVRVYDSESRGAKMAVAALRRKAAACKNSEELLQLCIANKGRFVDQQGKVLPFMEEFTKYVSELNDAHEKGATKGKKIDEIWNKQQARIKELRKKGYYDEQIDNDDVIKQTKKDMQNLDKEPAKEEPKNKGSAAEKSGKQEEPKTKNTEFTLDDISHIGDGKETKKVNDMETAKNVIKQIAEKYGATEKGRKELADFIALNIGGSNPLYDKIYNEFNISYDDLDMDFDASHDLILNQTLGKNTKKQREQIADSKGEFEENYRQMIENEERSFFKEENKKKKGIDAIRDKYQSSKSIEGDEDEIYVGKEAIQGRWKLVEADAPSASHDEITFYKTEGFPTAKDGSTVNDRDYEHDTAAQETVLDIAADFDGRALGFDSPIVVTQDGVVTSGNNRTMSSKLAARKGTDTKYIEALKKRAKKFGFSADDVAQFKHPRVVFETEHKGDYTTSEFAKYNESGKKAMNPVEKAVKVSKMIQPQTIEEIAGTIGDFDTMGDLYADRKASQNIFNTLIQSNIIQKTDLPQYYSDNTVTAAGKEFLETVLIGSVINESNIRELNTEGGRSIRQKLVRAITPLIENKGMKGYSINKELNEAVGIAIEVAHHKDQFPNVEAFSKQQDMFRKLDPVSIELAKKLEGTQKGFAEFMLEMNGGLRPAANGEVDIFLGDTESKEDIVNRVLNIKKTVKKALDKFFGLFGATA